ncbi:FtsX-like permease family protein [Oceanobacillus kapialis]|uniref:FtsX-like permease family protein n=1 Tax=Oceanobacillus kapialis TaxID=481353 RepID=UPI00384C385C
MTFIQFAFNNVKRNTRAYVSYFLSCMFAVTVFFMYAVIIFHPSIQNYEFHNVVQTGIIASQVLIYGFSFLFVLYSTGTFIKSRKKEFGLLTTLGIKKSQLNRLLILENTMIGILSILAGIAVGALLTKLFLMIFSAILGINDILPFHLSFQAIGLTALLFFIMFELNTLAVVWTLRTKSVMEVFRGSTKSRRKPTFSWIISAISLGAVLYAYYLAYTADLVSIMVRMFPILALIIPGTYFLYTQLSIAATSILKKNKSLLYRNLNLLTISDLAYKLKENARILFIVTILSAVAFTSSGVLFGLFRSVEAETFRFIPQAVSLISNEDAELEEFKKEITDIEKQFKDQIIPYESTVTTTLPAETESNQPDWDDTPVMVYAYSDYQHMMELKGEEVIAEPQHGEGILLLQDLINRYTARGPDSLTFKVGQTSTELALNWQSTTLNSSISTNLQLIVSDERYAQFRQAAGGGNLRYNYVMHIPNSIDYATETETILNQVRPEIAFVDSQANFYLMMKQSMSYLFFFGIFISVLFFLAAGSILYFRMYQGIDKDLKHYYSLYRIGLTSKEMKKIATRQLALLFFLPFTIAAIHAGFAFKALQNILVSNVLLPSIFVYSLYFAVHLTNFIIIRNIYTTKLNKVM